MELEERGFVLGWVRGVKGVDVIVSWILSLGWDVFLWGWVGEFIIIQMER